MKSYREASCAGVLCLAAFLPLLLSLPASAATGASISNHWLSSIEASAIPFLWSAWSGSIVLLALTAGIVFAVFRWQQRRFRKKTHQLENLVSARTIELAIANADLERLSITDPLTGLKNRRFVEFSIAEDLARVRRSFQCVHGEWQTIGEEAASINFLLIDIDHFKNVNDQYGHPAGDRVLRQMGALFSSMVRESDTTVRWGGEEFLIIARNPKGNDAAILAERIRNRVESTPFAIGDQKTVPLTCSIGFASWPFFRREPDAIGWQEVIGLADRGLYIAKNGGRNAWNGLCARPEYKGKITSSLLNDLAMAEKKGILRIQSSTSSAIAEVSAAAEASAVPEGAQPAGKSYPMHVV